MASTQMIKRIDGVMGSETRRVEILARDDGLFQFLERPWGAPDLDSPSAVYFRNLHRSGLYASEAEAEREARRHLTMRPIR